MFQILILVVHIFTDIMATNTSLEALPKPALASCKKCNIEHETPVGKKCEKMKNVNKEEKHDLSQESIAIKKTPKAKTSDSHEKMMDIMLSTMNSVTEKLTSMDESISGLASRIDRPFMKTSARKSRS